MVMAAQTEREPSSIEAVEIKRVANLLGGAKVLRQRLNNPLDVHEALSHGLPGAALRHLVGNVVLLRNQDGLAQIGRASWRERV